MDEEIPWSSFKQIKTRIELYSIRNHIFTEAYKRFGIDDKHISILEKYAKFNSPIWNGLLNQLLTAKLYHSLSSPDVTYKSFKILVNQIFDSKNGIDFTKSSPTLKKNIFTHFSTLLKARNQQEFDASAKKIISVENNNDELLKNLLEKFLEPIYYTVSRPVLYDIASEYSYLSHSTDSYVTDPCLVDDNAYESNETADYEPTQSDSSFSNDESYNSDDHALNSSDPIPTQPKSLKPKSIKRRYNASNTTNAKKKSIIKLGKKKVLTQNNTLNTNAKKHNWDSVIKAYKLFGIAQDTGNDVFAFTEQAKNTPKKSVNNSNTTAPPHPHNETKVSSKNDSSTPSKNKIKKAWTPEETNWILMQFKEKGRAWAEIARLGHSNGILHPDRTNIDIKDKIRNLELKKVVTTP